MSITSRRPLASVVCAAAACVLAVGVTPASAASSAPRATTSTITVAQQQPYNLLPIFVGLRHGFFKKAGITEVKYSTFQSLPVLFTSVAQGQIDIGLQTIPPMTAYNRATTGTKLMFIAPGQTDALVWAAGNGSPIPIATKADWKSTVLAWKGKKVGVPAFGGIIDLFTRYLVKAVGLTPGQDVTIVPVGAGAASIAALQAGVVDVTTGDPFTIAGLQPPGLGHSVLNFSAGRGPSELLGALTSGWFTSSDNLEKNRALWVGFAEGMAKARKFMADPKNRKDIIDIMVRKIGLPQYAADFLWKHGMPPMTAAQLNRAVFDKTVAGYLATGVMTAPAPTYSDLVADFVK